jgi:chromosome segregation ATPase
MSGRLAADERGMETAVTHSITQAGLVQPGQTDVQPTTGFATALAELEESTARVVALRHKVEQLTTGLAERQQALRELEGELSSLSASAADDRATVSRLETDVEGREELLAHLRTELTALAAELGFSGGDR